MLARTSDLWVKLLESKFDSRAKKPSLPPPAMRIAGKGENTRKNEKKKETMTIKKKNGHNSRQSFSFSFRHTPRLC